MPRPRSRPAPEAEGDEGRDGDGGGAWGALARLASGGGASSGGCAPAGGAGRWSGAGSPTRTSPCGEVAAKSVEAAERPVISCCGNVVPSLPSSTAGEAQDAPPGVLRLRRFHQRKEAGYTIGSGAPPSPEAGRRGHANEDRRTWGFRSGETDALPVMRPFHLFLSREVSTNVLLLARIAREPINLIRTGRRWSLGARLRPCAGHGGLSEGPGRKRRAASTRATDGDGRLLRAPVRAGVGIRIRLVARGHATPAFQFLPEERT
jgi:hypothetical protein